MVLEEDKHNSNGNIYNSKEHEENLQINDRNTFEEKIYRNRNK